MATLLLVVHVMIALALIVSVLLQRSEGGGLGIGGGGGMMSGRSTANLMTRTTAVLAGGFFLTSIALTILARNATTVESKIDSIKVEAPKDAGKVLDGLTPSKADTPATPVTPGAPAKQPDGPVVPTP